jgi:hypothetical protein
MKLYIHVTPSTGSKFKWAEFDSQFHVVTFH